MDSFAHTVNVSFDILFVFYDAFRATVVTGIQLIEVETCSLSLCLDCGGYVAGCEC
jgi:hypothetical protein